MTSGGGGAAIFPRNQLFLIAGPCVLEGDELNLRIAEEIVRLGDVVPGGVVFKASFDKANRSSVSAARGPGLEQGLRALEKVKQESGLRIITDVHLPEQCAPAAEVADALQIPAFLCRQTDLLVAAGNTGRPVNIKKGQWMHPEGMGGAAQKARSAGAAELAITERGTFYGYSDLVVDMRAFDRIRAACEAPVVFDATHSVQKPGQGEGGASGGAREFIPPLLYAAMGAGADGIFLETHPSPEDAPSDGPNMVPLKELRPLVERAVRLWQTARDE